MKVIYLVYAHYPYEGDEPVRAFAEEGAARVFAADCNTYSRTEPKGSFNSAERKAWRDNHLAKGNSSCDDFDVQEVPFGPV